jgi:hypothetical protein
MTERERTKRRRTKSPKRKLEPLRKLLRHPRLRPLSSKNRKLNKKKERRTKIKNSPNPNPSPRRRLKKL